MLERIIQAVSALKGTKPFPNEDGTISVYKDSEGGKDSDFIANLTPTKFGTIILNSGGYHVMICKEKNVLASNSTIFVEKAKGIMPSLLSTLRTVVESE